MWKIFYIKKVDKICIKEIKNNIRKKDRDEAEGNFVRIGVKKSNSCEQNVRGTYFYKNA